MQLLPKKIVFLYSLIIANITVNSWLAANYNILNSDSVWGNVLLPEIFKSRIFLNLDTFLLHYPFTFFSLYIKGYGETASTLNIFLLIFTTLLFFLIFYTYFIYKYLHKISLFYFLPFIFFINCSWSFYTYLAHPFYRNIEFGIAFLSLIYFDQIELHSSKLINNIVIYITIILLLFSDPYFLYVFIIPLIVVFTIKKLQFQKKIYLDTTLYIFSAAVIYFLSYIIVNLSKYFVIYNLQVKISSLTYMLAHIKTALYGVSLFFNILPWNTLSIINISIVFASVHGFYLLIKNYGKSQVISPLVFPLCLITTFLIFIVSTQTDSDPATIRYLIFIPFLVPFGLSFFLFTINSQRVRRAFGLILIVISLIHFITIYRNAMSAQKNNPYKDNYLIIKTIQQYQTSYGYTSYWNAGINTFLSQNRIRFRQVRCYKNHIVPYFWVSANSWYKGEKYGKKTFLLSDFSGSLTPEVKNCQFNDILKQFGKPEEIIPLKTSQGNISLLLFNYDIANNF